MKSTDMPIEDPAIALACNHDQSGEKWNYGSKTILAWCCSRGIDYYTPELVHRSGIGEIEQNDRSPGRSCVFCRRGCRECPGRISARRRYQFIISRNLYLWPRHRRATGSRSTPARSWQADLRHGHIPWRVLYQG